METQEITKRFERERALAEMSPDEMTFEDICDELVNCGKRMARIKFPWDCGAAMTKLAGEARICKLKSELSSRFEGLESQCVALSEHAFDPGLTYSGEEESDGS